MNRMGAFSPSPGTPGEGRGEGSRHTGRGDKSARGFSLIEIMLVISIIAILIAALLLGAGSLVTGSKTRSTKAMLATLQGMFGELDARMHRQLKAPAAWWWLDTGITTPSRKQQPPALSVPDFWNTPTTDVTLDKRSMDAPGLVSDDGYIADGTAAPSTSAAIRNGSRAILNTQIAMVMMLSAPANRAALEKIPADRYFTPQWVAATLTGPSVNGVLYDGATGQPEPVHYLASAKVQSKDGKFICTVDHDSPAGTPKPTGSSPWAADLSPVTPLLLDAWNNPIILVPATGLRVRMLNGAPNYNVYTPVGSTPANQTVIIVSPEGQANNNIQPPVLVRPGRPFFASAGPDGDFAKGDDNIYSFEQ